MKNYIFVIEDFSIGGVEKVTLRLIKSLKYIQPDLDVTVVYKSSAGCLYSQYKDVVDNLLSVDNLRSCQMNVSLGVVIFTKGGLTVLKRLFHNASAFIAVQHVPIDLPEASVLKNFIRIVGAAILYRQVDRVICVSDGIRHNLLKKIRLASSKVKTIYNPVLNEDIKAQSLERVHYENYYVCVGRLHYQKGYDRLIEVVKECIDRELYIKVVVVGDGPDFSSLSRRITEEGLSENIILHGSDANPYKFMKNAKALLLTSRWEGLPTVLVESAYLGIQSVSFDCRYGPRELTKNGKFGYLVEDGAISQFVDCIQSIESGRFLQTADVCEFLDINASRNYYDYIGGINEF
ncbi:glycosyltransferase [Shewanella algae]|uniref:glycosyltransferase n=1 Tax=Shewanella algae TaxID=38313 RepID=UPI003004CF48